MVEQPDHYVAGLVSARQCMPMEEQIVIVEHALIALAFDVGAEHRPNAIDFSGAPRKAHLEHVGQLLPGVDHP